MNEERQNQLFIDKWNEKKIPELDVNKFINIETDERIV